MDNKESKLLIEKLNNRRMLKLNGIENRLTESREDLKSCKNAVIQGHLLHERILLLTHRMTCLLDNLDSLKDEADLSKQEARLFEDKYHDEILLNQKLFDDLKFEQNLRKGFESQVDKLDKTVCELRSQLGTRASQVLQLQKELKQQRSIIRKLNNHE